MVRGRGASSGPDLSAIAARTTRAELEHWLDNPTSLMGTKSLPICPGWAFCADFQWAMQNVVLKSGEKLRGFARRRTEHEVALQTLDGKFRMLPIEADRHHRPGQAAPTCRNSTATPPSAGICWPIWARWAASMPAAAAACAARAAIRHRCRDASAARRLGDL